MTLERCRHAWRGSHGGAIMTKVMIAEQASKKLSSVSLIPALTSLHSVIAKRRHDIKCTTSHDRRLVPAPTLRVQRNKNREPLMPHTDLEWLYRFFCLYIYLGYDVLEMSSAPGPGLHVNLGWHATNAKATV